MDRRVGFPIAVALAAVLFPGALVAAAPAPADRLVQALRACNLEQAGEALEAGADPNAKGPDGPLFPLVLPCPGPDLARLLLRRGLDPKRRDAEGYDALLRAARAGRTDLVKLLLDLGGDPNTALPDALPERGAPPPRPGALARDSALGLAVKGKWPETFALLLDAGADPNRPGEGGTPLLYTAVEKKQLATARALLDHGADANCRRDGKPVFIEALSGGIDMLVLLIDHEADINAATIDPDGRGGPGETALMSAVSQHKKDLVRYLIAAGADVSIRNAAGDSALDLAEAEKEAGRGDPEIVQLLREAAGRK